MSFVITEYLSSKMNGCTTSHFQSMAFLKQIYEVLPKVRRFNRHLGESETPTCCKEDSLCLDSTLAIFKMLNQLPL